MVAGVVFVQAAVGRRGARESRGLGDVYTRQDVVVQIIVLCAVLLVFCALQAFGKPWRSRIANILDLACSILLVFVLFVGAVAADLDVPGSTLTALCLPLIHHWRCGPRE